MSFRQKVANFLANQLDFSVLDESEAEAYALCFRQSVRLQSQNKKLRLMLAAAKRTAQRRLDAINDLQALNTERRPFIQELLDKSGYYEGSYRTDSYLKDALCAYCDRQAVTSHDGSSLCVGHVSLRNIYSD